MPDVSQVRMNAQRNVWLCECRPTRAPRWARLTHGAVKLVVVASVALWVLQTALLADPAPDVERWENLLRNTPAAELPASVAKTLQQAGPAQLPATATNVVKLAVRINPAATLAIVSAASAAEPQLVGIISEIAAGEQKQLAPEIARCAALACPLRAREIVIRVGQLAPTDLRSIALEVSRVAPSQNREIIRAAGTVRPELWHYLEQELERYGRTMPSVSRCFDRAEQARERQARAASKSSGGEGLRAQPAVPPSSKPPRGGANPPGGRNYARP